MKSKRPSDHEHHQHRSPTSRQAPGKSNRAHAVYANMRPSGRGEVQKVELAEAALDPAAVQNAAAEGVAGGGRQLPHLAAIQSSFGSYDVSGVDAHVGGAAKSATDAIGAQAYATGNSVAFGEAPDLHTAAHEAAHVVQQRAGVQLKGGVGEAGDVYEQHADAVADAVIGGKAAELILGQFGSGTPAPNASSGPIQLKKKEKDTSFVGGEGKESFNLKAPDESEWVKPGEGGYARNMQGATVQVAESIAKSVKDMHMAPVQPALGGVAKATKICQWEKGYYERERPSLRSTSVVEKIWDDRVAYAEAEHLAFAEDGRCEAANFQSYNSFAPVGNALIMQLARVEAQQKMLGITDDLQMQQALLGGLQDASAVGGRAQKAYDKNKAGSEDIEAPKSTTSVEGALADVRDSGASMDAAYVNFQRELISADVKKLKGEAAPTEAKLKEINDVKKFLQDIAGSVDTVRGKLKSAPTDVANAVASPSSLLPSAAKATELVADFVFYEDVQKLTIILDNINGRIAKKNVTKEFAAVSSRVKKYKAALRKFATAAQAMQRALHDRRVEYRELGTKLDRFSQGDSQSKKDGVAAGKGGDRYSTMLALVVEIRQAVAMAKFVKTGMPPLEGGAGQSTSKSEAWAAWGNPLISRRNSHAHYVSGFNHPRIEMPWDEQHALDQVYKHLQRSDKYSDITTERYQGISDAAAELMKKLGGMGGV